MSMHLYTKRRQLTKRRKRITKRRKRITKRRKRITKASGDLVQTRQEDRRARVRRTGGCTSESTALHAPVCCHAIMYSTLGVREKQLYGKTDPYPGALKC
eukprot:3856397-Heterocapsa_arctica.AAC.1